MNSKIIFNNTPIECQNNMLCVSDLFAMLRARSPKINMASVINSVACRQRIEQICQVQLDSDSNTIPQLKQMGFYRVCGHTKQRRAYATPELFIAIAAGIDMYTSFAAFRLAEQIAPSLYERLDKTASQPA